MNQMLLKAFITSFAFLCHAKTFAASTSVLEFTHNSKTAIRAKISETAPTRINFGGYQITEVIGDENKYKIITDGNGFNVFITPKIASGSVIPLTLIAASNKVQDLLLEVSDKEKLPRSLIITPDASKKDKVLPQRSETELMLRAMLEDDNPNDKYYITSVKKKMILSSLPQLTVTRDKTWRFKNLTGVRLIITNLGRRATNLHIEHIAKLFKGTGLTVIDDNLLRKGASTKAFIILGEEND